LSCEEREQVGTSAAETRMITWICGGKATDALCSNKEVSC